MKLIKSSYIGKVVQQIHICLPGSPSCRATTSSTSSQILQEIEQISHPLNHIQHEEKLTNTNSISYVSQEFVIRLCNSFCCLKTRLMGKYCDKTRRIVLWPTILPRRDCLISSLAFEARKLLVKLWPLTPSMVYSSHQFFLQKIYPQHSFGSSKDYILSCAELKAKKTFHLKPRKVSQAGKNEYLRGHFASNISGW